MPVDAGEVYDLKVHNNERPGITITLGEVYKVDFPLTTTHPQSIHSAYYQDRSQIILLP